MSEAQEDKPKTEKAEEAVAEKKVDDKKDKAEKKPKKEKKDAEKQEKAGDSEKKEDKKKGDKAEKAEKEKKDKKGEVKKGKSEKKAGDKEKAAEKKEEKEEEPKGIVVHRNPPALHAPSSSPFVLKLETFFRVAKLDYKTDNEKNHSGKRPWVTIDGEQKHQDTQHIIDYIKKEKKVDLDKDLDRLARAQSRAFRLMIESHFYFVSLALTYAKENDKFVKNMWGVSGFFQGPRASSEIKQLRTQAEQHGVGRHHPKEIVRFGRKDLEAVRDFLGEKPYLFGDKPTVADCSLFGALAQVLYHSPPENNKLKAWVEKDAKELVAFTERVRETYWPDWNELCREPIPTAKEQAEIDRKEAERKKAEEEEKKRKKAEKEKKKAEKAEQEAKEKEKAEKEAAEEKPKEDKAAEKGKDKEEAKEDKPKEKKKDDAKAKASDDKKKEKAKDKDKKKEKKADEKPKEKPEGGESEEKPAPEKAEAVPEEKAADAAEA